MATSLSRPAVDGDEPDRASLLGGPDYLGEGEQRDIHQASGYVAPQRFQQSR